MEETTPKVHRHSRRSESRHRRRHDQQQRQTQEQPTTHAASNVLEGCANDTTTRTRTATTETTTTTGAPIAAGGAQEPKESQSTAVNMQAVTPSPTPTPPQPHPPPHPQHTVVLVNGHQPPQSPASAAGNGARTKTGTGLWCEDEVEDPHSNDAESPNAMSLRETLQQLPSTSTAHREASKHRGSPTPTGLGLGAKPQSLSDPQASPAQRSLRSRSSLEKSPRRKRSKSESRRRRERKLIAAGEMEVRQANETLMRYLKQCSEVNDASLSGELEIDQSYDERRVHRKTKSQRDKRGHLISKLYTAGGLSSILKELSDDIIPADGEEIYNPFTPVVSPTEDTPAHIDKMFLQTSSGYRPVEHCYHHHHHFRQSLVGGRGDRLGAHAAAAAAVATAASGRGGSASAGAGSGGSGRRESRHGLPSTPSMEECASFYDNRCLLHGDECRRQDISSKVQLACFIQRIWLLLSNICHGLLAGLALAHLLFVLSSSPKDALSLAGETLPKSDYFEDPASNGPPAPSAQPLSITDDYATFAEVYLNTFYCLAIVCLISVLDRMDICRWNLSHATELISFRWLIIAMIYIATIILTICSNSIDERLYYNNNVNVTLSKQEMLSNSVLNVWSSLSVTRSIASICGWIMIGLTPHEDLLYAHLVDLTRYQLTNN